MSVLRNETKGQVTVRGIDRDMAVISRKTYPVNIALVKCGNELIAGTRCLRRYLANRIVRRQAAKAENPQKCDYSDHGASFKVFSSYLTAGNVNPSCGRPAAFCRCVDKKPQV